MITCTCTEFEVRAQGKILVNTAQSLIGAGGSLNSPPDPTFFWEGGGEG